MIQPLAEKNGNRLEVACDAATGTMHADLTKVRQVLFNLLSNACKFTERGTVSLTVGRDSTSAGEWLSFEVKDTGIGIAGDKQAGIFDAFVQADESMTRRYGGTGLGLTIARAIVRLMGGELGVASEPGRGSLFWFRVRLPEARAIVPGPARSAAAAGKAHAGRRVLVAEDDKVNAEVTRAMLLSQGIEVVLADDGAQAVNEHGRGRFDLILMDCQMPAMDGFEAARRIRQAESAHGARTPIVALTAHAIAGYRQRCLEVGMDDYLAKPYTAETFGAVLRQWLDRGER